MFMVDSVISVFCDYSNEFYGMSGNLTQDPPRMILSSLVQKITLLNATKSPAIFSSL